MKPNAALVYRHITREDYDQTIKLEGTKIQCYSKDQMDKLYPNGEYILVGETKRKNKKTEIAALNVWRSRFSVSTPGDNSKIFYRKAGYVNVGQDQYVVLLKHRFAFLIWFFGLLLGVALAILLLIAALRDKDPTIIDPDHPLPTEDPNAQTVPDEGHEHKAESADGGGSVSMIYTLSVELQLSTGEADIYFRNPGVSNHDIALVLYVVSGEEEYPIAQSGLVKAGNELKKMTVLEDTVQLSAGTYSGKFKVLYYDPLTGEKAMVEPEITDLVITVSQ